MSNTTDKAVPDIEVLADLAALKISGPAIVFFRPRRPMSLDQVEEIHKAAVAMSRRETNVSFVMLRWDLDIMAVGEVELERYGLRRIT
jgi:hypothetical protein